MHLTHFLLISCLIFSPFFSYTNTNSVESAHKVLKDYIPSSQGDLLSTWRSIEQAVANQIVSIKADAARDQIRTPIEIDQRQYHACFSQITVTALREVRDNHRNALQKARALKKPLEPCTGVYTMTTGLPCAHKVEQTRQLGLQPQDFHVHWFWDRYQQLAPPILEPLQVISYTSSSQNRRAASSTKRLPSGFEATEDKERRCGQCRLPGHTRASQRCPVNIRRAQEEFRPQSSTQLTSSSASLFIPRSTVQSILDSASQSTLKSALQSVLDSGDQLILKSTIQSILESTSQPVLNSTSQTVLNSTSQPVVNSTSQTALNSTNRPVVNSTTLPVVNSTTLPVVNSTTQPVPESIDTRPIWPGRPELIYRQYLAEREFWLADNPGVRPASYRRARGLEIYPYHWIRERRRELPIQRLDLDTEILLEGIADWTNAEVSAWLDWDKIKDQEVERQVEAELVIEGGFGQGRRRGVQGHWNRLEADIEARNAQYRFADYSIVR
jgi:hypothetical protein